MSSQILLKQSSAALDAWVRLLRGGTALRRSLSAELQSAHGLSINDFEALLVLARAEGGRMRRIDLAGELVLTASGVTRLLDGLERAGLVEKAACASDARVSYAKLTDTGRAKLRDAGTTHLRGIEELFEGSEHEWPTCRRVQHDSEGAPELRVNVEKRKPHRVQC